MEVNFEEKKHYEEYVKGLVNRYYTEENLEKMRQAVERRDTLKKEYARGGLSVPRGAYCRSLLMEIRVSNVSRGKILKNTSQKAPDYIFYFDEDEDLILAQKLPGVPSETWEYIDQEEDREFSIRTISKMNEKVRLEISETSFDKSYMCKNQYLNVLLNENDREIENYSLHIEEYTYDKGQLKKGTLDEIELLCNNVYQEEMEYWFVYSNEGELKECWLNGDKEWPCRIPPSLKALITGTPEEKNKGKKNQLSKSVKKALEENLREWDEPGIYAISCFINHDEDDVTEFAISYNAESDCAGAGPFDEERWNYAFWRQDEIDLMDVIDEAGAEVSWNELLDVVSDVVAKIQSKGVIKKQFKRLIPVIIHGYEYTKEELEATRKANPNGEAEDFFKWMGISLR